MGRVLIAAGALLVAAPSVAFEVGDRWRLEPTLRVGGGVESDLVLDPAVTRTVVDAGPFFDLTPSLSFERDLGPRLRLRFGTQATFERFLNDDRRRVFAQSLDAELRRTGPVWRLFVGGGGHFFDDSERTTVRRVGAGADLRFGRSAGPAWVDLVGGAAWRLYPELAAPDAQGSLGDYEEYAANLGLAGGIRLGRKAWTAADLRISRTDARDPLFDSTSVATRVDAGYLLSPELRLRVSGAWQRRAFAERARTLDEDQYAQAGTSIEWELPSTQRLGLQIAWARYRWPDGSEEDTQRFELRWTLPFGGRVPARSVSVVESVDPARTAVTDDGRIRFMFFAPDAQRVSVVGDFNGWDPARHPLTADEDGWWRGVVDLPAGTYQYLYAIDGHLRLPNAGEEVLDDGFGGKNALLRVPARDGGLVVTPPGI